MWRLAPNPSRNRKSSPMGSFFLVLGRLRAAAAERAFVPPAGFLPADAGGWGSVVLCRGRGRAASPPFSRGRAAPGPPVMWGHSVPHTPRGTLSVEKEFPESQPRESPWQSPLTGVPPGTLNIVGMEMQRSPKAARLRRTPMFGSRRTDVLEFLSGPGRQESLPCQDAEKKTSVTKAPLPDKNPLTRHEHRLPVCLLGRPG